MIIRLTEEAGRQFHKLPRDLQKKTRKQFSYLLVDFRHPSLKVKKYQDVDNLWQGRVDKGYRFYFYIVEPEYLVISIINHPK